MYLLLDTDLSADLPYLIGVAVILLGCFLYYRKVKRDQAALKRAEHDPRSHAVNDTNYNIAREGIDGHRDEGLSKNEAKQAVETLKETGQIPSREEFNEIKEDLDKE